MIRVFFDFLFYGIYTEYAKKEKGAQSSASTIIGGLWMMNLSVLAMTIPLFFPTPDFLTNKLGFLGLAIVFQILAYFLYARRGMDYIDQIREKWIVKTDRAKIWIRTLIVAYIAASVLAFFGMAIYVGLQK